MINPIVETDVKRIIKRVGKKFELLSGKRILITGASGLIGSYFVETISYLNENHLLKKSCQIIALQKRKILKKSRLGYLLGRKNVKFVSHNTAFKYAPTQKIDYFVHAAGMSAPAFFLADPLGTIDVNVNGMRWILEYAKNNPEVKSLLYMSSGEIYGNPPKEFIPTPETYAGNVSTFDIRACYTSSKRLAETLCHIYWEKFNVPVKIARPFIVYGPGLDDTDKRVMAEFIRHGLAGKPIQMLNEGRDTRSYCYIADAVVAFFELLFSDKNGEAFNVASDLEEVSIKDLAQLVHELCQIKQPVHVKLQNTQYIIGAPNRVRPDIFKLKKTLRYRPEIGIKEGLSRTITWNKIVNKL